MSKKAMIGFGGGILAIVAAVVIYLVGFSGGPGGPTGGGDAASGKAKAEKLFSALNSSGDFKARGGQVTWGSAENLGDQGVLIKNLSIKGKNKKGEAGEVTAEELRVKRLDWNKINGSPYADIEIKGLTSKQFAESPQFKGFMATTGMKNLILDMKIRYEYKADGQLMDVQEVVVTARELGTFTLRAQIHGLDISALQGMQKAGKVDPAQMMGMAAAIRIGKIYLSFKDNGAIDKSATMQAKKTGADKDKVMSGMIAQLEQQKAAIPVEIGKKAADAVIKFLKNKSTLIAKADPANPVAVLQLVMGGRSIANIDKIAKQLNVSITAD